MSKHISEEKYFDRGVNKRDGMSPMKKIEKKGELQNEPFHRRKRKNQSEVMKGDPGEENGDGRAQINICLSSILNWQGEENGGDQGEECFFIVLRWIEAWGAKRVELVKTRRGQRLRGN